jgi:radical SAM superfamily enzyme YgiQ (UPF0313 family)
MEKILIINIDSKIANLALKKIEKYHSDRGDEIIWNFPLARNYVDKIYVSCIFDWNKHLCEEWVGDAEIGGSGWDYSKQLPLEIDAIKPRINYGFTTRGCIRSCKFCIVPKKEGKIRVEGDIYDLWDGTSKNLTLLDNNILALPSHFELICEQLKKEKLVVDFNQGLDHRLLTQDLIKLMKSIRHKEYRFAFDHPNSQPTVEKAISLLKKNGINRCNWYVLVGFDTTIEEDLYRLNYLREQNQVVYVQRYKHDDIYIPIARWANQHHIFRGMTWEQFLAHPLNKKYAKMFAGRV